MTKNEIFSLIDHTSYGMVILYDTFGIFTVIGKTKANACIYKYMHVTVCINK